MATTTLKPGLLVSLRTSMSGGVEYTRVDIESANGTEGASREKWETTKVVQDPAEHERATKVRGKCGSLIRAVCVPSAFGYLCPMTSEKQLDEAIVEARALAETFNREARTTRVAVYCLKGKIAETDDEAARAVSGELRELLDEMRAGIGEANVEKIREAASKAKKIGTMLDEVTAGKVTRAIDEARTVAKDIVKKLVAGEDIATTVQAIQLKALDEARFAFLDLDADAPTGERLAPVETRGLDLDETL